MDPSLDISTSIGFAELLIGSDAIVWILQLIPKSSDMAN